VVAFRGGNGLLGWSSSSSSSPPAIIQTGTDNYGKLGMGDTTTEYSTPTMISGLENGDFA
jgi:hypothetical protein